MSNEMPSCVASRRGLPFLLPLLAALATAHGQPLSGKDVAAMLHGGGYVILMRHASSPRTPPNPAQANADNVQHERQLDDQGRSSARAMGEAVRQLHIPIGLVLSSPTYRALETLRLAQLGPPKTDSHLGDSGQSMQVDSGGTRAAWLRAKVAERPSSGTNTIIITHFPNINEAFANDAAGLGDGEALIFRPDGRGAAAFVGRVKIEDWPRWAAAH
jgi:phosphohistidine phosphatase SixA